MPQDLHNRLKLELINYFGAYVSDHKKALIDRVLAQRTRYLSVVVEDIYQSQNASAVLRTCECLGIQDFHVIENHTRYEINKRVVMGASKWVNVIRHRQKGINNTLACYRQLKEKGYRVVATVPTADAVPLDELPIDQKLAIVLGNELRGLSKEAIEEADLKSCIPLHGFTESFNISVTAAIYLHALMGRLRESEKAWGLGRDELIDLKLEWFRKTVKRAEVLEKEFLRSFE